MADYTSRKQIPADSGGSYEPQEGLPTPKYVLKEKVGEMIRYALPVITAFPARDRGVADILRDSMLTLYRLAIELDHANNKEPVVRKLRIELSVLKDFIGLASDKDAYMRKYAPPLSLKKREVWGRYNRDIGLLIDGLG